MKETMNMFSGSKDARENRASFFAGKFAVCYCLSVMIHVFLPSPPILALQGLVTFPLLPVRGWARFCDIFFSKKLEKTLATELKVCYTPK